VRIAQLLCLRRHCILAAAYESPDGAAILEKAATVKAKFDEAVQAGILNPWCGLCAGSEMHVEDHATEFRSLAEATPRLSEEEKKQLKTGEAIAKLRASAEKQ
jgi:hypothetical protein